MLHAAICCLLLSAHLGMASLQVDAVEKDLRRLQGGWTFEKVLVGGEKVGGETQPKGFVFDGREISPDDDPKDVAIITLDPSQTPQTIDLVYKNKEKSLGIYEIDGDTLKLCFNAPGDPRPKTFASAKGSRVSYFILKRNKK